MHSNINYGLSEFLEPDFDYGVMVSEFADKYENRLFLLLLQESDSLVLISLFSYLLLMLMKYNLKGQGKETKSVLSSVYSTHVRDSIMRHGTYIYFWVENASVLV